MCGSTPAQNQIQQAQIDAYTQAQNLAKEEFAHQQAIYGPMAAKFQSIFDLGQGQEGFAPAEKEALETQIVEGNAQNYAGAARAVNQSLVSSGGVAMPSGAAEQLKLNTALSSAQEKSREETSMTAADYAQGRTNWENAGKGLMTIAAGENPLGYLEASTAAGGAASTTANEIAQAQNSWMNAAAGIGGALISQNPHNVFG